MNAFTCFAHRGASGHAPENTLLSIRKAIEIGAPWIEVDVYWVDGELIVIHDRQLDRTTNGTGDVSNQSIPYLRSLDAGKGEKIPFLHEVFDAVSGLAGINVELKGEDTAEPVARLIGDYVTQNKLDYDHVIVSAFNHRLLREVNARNAHIRLGALVETISQETVSVATGLGAYAIHVRHSAVTADFISEAHRHGLKVFVYTLNRIEGIRQMRAMGIDGVFTNYPELCAPE